MRNLEISIWNGGASISYEKEIPHVRKESINPNEDKLKDEATEISKAVRYLKGFKSFRIGYGQIDWYESCNQYEVPYAACTADNRRVKIQYNYYNDIPKAWSKYYTLRLESVSDIRGFNKFLDAMGIKLDPKILNKFRKAIKEQKSFSIDLDEE